MKYAAGVFIGVFLMLWGTGVSALEVRQVSATYTLYTVSGFIDLLVEQGIIPSERAAQARMYGMLVERSQAVRAGQDHVASGLEISASQLIEYSKLSFGRFEDIKGLVLLVRNLGEAPVVLEHVQACPVTYRIIDAADAVLYDSAQQPACKSDEFVGYQLEAGESRMFELEHRHRERALTPGTYQFEMQYGQYGSDTRTVTIR